MAYKATPDAVVRLAAELGREWPYGAGIVVLEPLCNGHAIAECASTDGGRWWIGADRYGGSFVHADTRDAVMAALSATWQASLEVRT